MKRTHTRAFLPSRADILLCATIPVLDGRGEGRERDHILLGWREVGLKFMGSTSWGNLASDWVV